MTNEQRAEQNISDYYAAICIVLVIFLMSLRLRRRISQKRESGYYIMNHEKLGRRFHTTAELYQKV